jgi:hypothetical protein
VSLSPSTPRPFDATEFLFTVRCRHPARGHCFARVSYTVSTFPFWPNSGTLRLPVSRCYIFYIRFVYLDVHHLPIELLLSTLGCPLVYCVYSLVSGVTSGFPSGISLCYRTQNIIEKGGEKTQRAASTPGAEATSRETRLRPPSRTIARRLSSSSPGLKDGRQD